MANSGGGVVVLGGRRRRGGAAPRGARALRGAGVRGLRARGDHARRPAGDGVVVEGVADTPLVFTRQAATATRTGTSTSPSHAGGLYFRHGAKSEPATGADVRDFIKRQLDATRSQWLANIRQVMHAPDGAEVAVIETAERDERRAADADPLDDRPARAAVRAGRSRTSSHPYRQKEVIREVNASAGRLQRQRVRHSQRPPRARHQRGDETGVRPRPEVRLTAVQRRVRRLARRRGRAGSGVLLEGKGEISRDEAAPARGHHSVTQPLERNGYRRSHCVREEKQWLESPFISKYPRRTRTARASSTATSSAGSSTRWKARPSTT